ncbi:hypothetical protein FSP39_005689 [Pinctada imbricata]|uniref:Rho GTPase-activating protein 17 n=1 Tax=Pinctada imbricata TaxID=66713 RepID=A0AA89BNQ2_PINIB|nr:hypothetical protein FSP39_005689 [Pinctada imbricata]
MLVSTEGCRNIPYYTRKLLALWIVYTWAEKSEVLSEDLQSVEKRVELVRVVCASTTKKVSAGLQGTGPDMEKRMKKLPESQLAQNMIENANLLGTESIMGSMFQMCGECEYAIARHLLQYEYDIEKSVLQPLQEILDSEIPVISKAKKQLTKLTLDMDSARSRWNEAVKQTQVHGANVASKSAKADQVKEEYEESCNRMYMARDNLATEMFNFVAKEAEHSSKLLEILKVQKEYHRKALEEIEKIMPKMNEALECNPHKPVYGVPLEEHLRVTGRDIALVIEACICTLIEGGLDEEGLFRIAGMASKVKKLKNSFDANVVDMEDYIQDLHSVAGALKQYLRELPEPLLTTSLYPEFMKASQLPQDQKLQSLWSALRTIPDINYNNFRYLIKFLAKLAARSSENKMTPSNISIVIGPNLLWSEDDDGPNMVTSGTISNLIELIIVHADWFFPEEIDYQKTSRGTAPPKSPGANESTASSSTPITATVYPMPQNKRQGYIQAKACGMPYNTTSGLVPNQDSSSTISDERMSSEGSSDIHASSRLSSEERALSSHSPNVDSGMIGSEGESHRLSSNSHIGRGALTRNSCSRLSATNSVSSANNVTNATVSAESVPPSTAAPKGLHSDVYNTMFALHSLGNGNVHDYRTKVRALWDGHMHHKSTGSQGQIDKLKADRKVGTHRRCVSQEIEFRSLDSLELKSSLSDAVPVSHDVENPGSNRSSGTVSPNSSTNNLASMNNNGSGSLAPLAEDEDTSPKVQKRIPRKPAPPPPERPSHLPERPFSVAVTASYNKGQGDQALTWPRNATTPGKERISGSTEDVKPKSPTDKPSLPDKPGNAPQRSATMADRHSHHDRPSVPPPERPKIPPPAVPTHQRSASAGSASNINATLNPELTSKPLDSENEQGRLSSSSQSQVSQSTLGTSVLTPGMQTSQASGDQLSQNNRTHTQSKPVRPPVPKDVVTFNIETEQTRL